MKPATPLTLGVLDDKGFVRRGAGQESIQALVSHSIECQDRRDLACRQ